MSIHIGGFLGNKAQLSGMVDLTGEIQQLSKPFGLDDIIHIHDYVNLLHFKTTIFTVAQTSLLTD